MARARCPRSSVETGEKCVEIKGENRARFFSLSENRCLREFVVDSGASMHMISKKDLNSSELKTLTTSRSFTTVITVNGEVQTHEEAPTVLSLGKLCDENGYSYVWINGQKPQLIKNGIRIQCDTDSFVLIVAIRSE